MRILNQRISKNLSSTVFKLLIFNLSTVGHCCFVCRSAARSKVVAEDLVKELKHSLAWSDGSLSVIKHLWADQVGKRWGVAIGRPVH